MRTIRACVAVAAPTISAAPAAAATFIGDAVVIKRFQGVDTLVKTVSTNVGGGIEYDDNFFRIDINANQVQFDAISGFSIGSIFYEIAGLDFDGDAATPNQIEAFSSTQIFGTVANPFGIGRAAFTPSGAFRFSLANTNGGTDGLATVTFGAAPVAGVPEPATWAMLIGGFGLAGGAIRRARRQRLRLAYSR